MKNTLAELVDRLKTSKVKFEFKKKDGSIREAIGTQCRDYLPDQELSKTRNEIKKSGVITYYDFTVDGWRCFSDSTEIKILD